MILTYRIERRHAGPDKTYFVRRTGRRPWLETYDADQVPPFEGAEAYFEVEILPRKPLRFIRQLEAPRRSPA
jgi:hypothetical protein